MIIFEEWEAWVYDEDRSVKSHAPNPMLAIKQAVDHVGGITEWSPNVQFKIRRLNNGSDGGYVACNEVGEWR